MALHDSRGTQTGQEKCELKLSYVEAVIMCYLTHHITSYITNNLTQKPYQITILINIITKKMGINCSRDIFIFNRFPTVNTSLIESPLAL